MRNKLIMLVGLPGSGKSTWAKEQKAKDSLYCEWISRDAIRFHMVAEDEQYFSKEKEVFQQFVDDLTDPATWEWANLVIADATHMTVKSRQKILKHFKNNPCVSIEARVFTTSVEECQKRNETRKGDRAYVPPEVIETMSKIITKPTLNEGFEQITFVDENGFEETIRQRHYLGIKEDEDGEYLYYE